MLGLAVEPTRPLPIRSNIEAELCGNDYLFTMGTERLAYEFFVRERPIRFRSIEECHAAINRFSDHVDGLLLFDGRTVAIAQPHATKAECRDFKSAFPERALLHLILLPQLSTKHSSEPKPLLYKSAEFCGTP